MQFSASWMQHALAASSLRPTGRWWCLCFCQRLV